MKKQLLKRSIAYYLFPVILLLLTGYYSFGQAPQDVPHPSDSKPLVLDNWPYIITFILIPLFFIVLYLWLRGRRKRP